MFNICASWLTLTIWNICRIFAFRQLDPVTVAIWVKGGQKKNRSAGFSMTKVEGKIILHQKCRDVKLAKQACVGGAILQSGACLFSKPGDLLETMSSLKLWSCVPCE